MSGLQPSLTKFSYSRTEAALALGVSTETVDRAIRDGQIKTIRLRSKILIARSELERIVAGCAA